MLAAIVCASLGHATEDEAPVYSVFFSNLQSDLYVDGKPTGDTVVVRFNYRRAYRQDQGNWEEFWVRTDSSGRGVSVAAPSEGGGPATARYDDRSFSVVWDPQPEFTWTIEGNWPALSKSRVIHHVRLGAGGWTLSISGTVGTSESCNLQAGRYVELRPRAVPVVMADSALGRQRPTWERQPTVPVPPSSSRIEVSGMPMDVLVNGKPIGEWAVLDFSVDWSRSGRRGRPLLHWSHAWLRPHDKDQAIYVETEESNGIVNFISRGDELVFDVPFHLRNRHVVVRRIGRGEHDAEADGWSVSMSWDAVRQRSREQPNDLPVTLEFRSRRDPIVLPFKQFTGDYWVNESRIFNY